jgi:hypothetical protein
MKARHLKARLLLFFATILLLVLAFPSTLHARITKTPQSNSISVTAQRASEALQRRVPVIRGQEQSGERASLLLDEDIRVRAATVLVGVPGLKRSAQGAHVPLTVLVITAPVILDV